MTDKKKREEQIMKYVPLVKNIVGRIILRLPSHVDKEDLINVGIIGLMSALERFDEAKNVKFETYARFRIRGAILDELRSRDAVSRSARNKGSKLEKAYAALQMELGRMPTDEEVTEYLDISLEQYYKLLNDARGVYILNTDDLTPDYLRKNALQDVLEKIDQDNPLSVITNTETKEILKSAIEALSEKERIVLSLYYYEELTLLEIGKVMELTESRICQIHSKAILKLRSVLKTLKDRENIELLSYMQSSCNSK
ncbi:MAG TPA: FliA/WhiG family RNA polymerase sigma factor [Anaerolineae bacterium]|nr:FliA/WhiG family RNA polymerase sigma factor [Anaerolineae bacterium]